MDSRSYPLFREVCNKHSPGKEECADIRGKAMKYLTLAAFGAALLLGDATVSAQEFVDCKTPNANANSKAFFSANTNSGKGNGTDLAHRSSFFGDVCLVNGPGVDGDVQIGNAANPVFFGTTASDPGNSPN